MDSSESPFGRRFDDAVPAPRLARQGNGTDTATCDRIILAICDAQKGDQGLTIWDLAARTGIPLHETFAALRTLEFGKMIEIHDDPRDPFGARLALRHNASAHLTKLRMA